MKLLSDVCIIITILLTGVYMYVVWYADVTGDEQIYL